MTQKRVGLYNSRLARTPDRGSNYLPRQKEIQIGSGLFRQQIIDGVPEEQIRASWEPALTEYKLMRKKYLLYP
jgi:hypothetical protein